MSSDILSAYRVTSLRLSGVPDYPYVARVVLPAPRLALLGPRPPAEEHFAFLALEQLA